MAYSEAVLHRARERLLQEKNLYEAETAARRAQVLQAYPRLREIDQALRGLRSFMFDEVYQGPVCLQERERASFIVQFLFEYFLKHVEAMPEFYVQTAEAEGKERAVADYISGMTDNYCVELFKDLTIPRSFIHENPVL